MCRSRLIWSFATKPSFTFYLRSVITTFKCGTFNTGKKKKVIVVQTMSHGYSKYGRQYDKEYKEKFKDEWFNWDR